MSQDEAQEFLFLLVSVLFIREETGGKFETGVLRILIHREGYSALLCISSILEGFRVEHKGVGAGRHGQFHNAAGFVLIDLPCIEDAVEVEHLVGRIGVRGDMASVRVKLVGYERGILHSAESLGNGRLGVGAGLPGRGRVARGNVENELSGDLIRFAVVVGVDFLVYFVAREKACKGYRSCQCQFAMSSHHGDLSCFIVVVEHYFW